MGRYNVLARLVPAIIAAITTIITVIIYSGREAPSSSSDDVAPSYSFVPEMVEIPAGTYKVGLSSAESRSLVDAKLGNETDFFDETPSRFITVDKYEISKYEITIGQFNEFLLDVGREKKRFSGHLKSDNHPIVDVSWYEANEYCVWLSQKTDQKFRLPYEIEWEIAARGSTNNLYAWGNDQANNTNCNYKHSYKNSTVSYLESPSNRSPLGVYNLSGNAAEWCYDWYHENHYRLISDGKIIKLPETQDKVIRGGGWSSIEFEVRCTSRFFASPSDKSNAIGFRIAKTIK